MKKKKSTKKKTVKKKVTGARSRRILSAGEPPSFRIETAKGRGRGLIICDHASFRVPRGLKDMGLKKTVLKQHIGWDIGAEDAALHISRRLDMPAVIAQYSRLVYDLNRAPQHHEAMLEESDHIKIPGNAGLSKKDRAQRVKEIYQPYHGKIEKLLTGFGRKKQVPLIIAVHSFTPQMDGFRRPWHISIMWNREAGIARRVVQEIHRLHPDILVGENQPYKMAGDDRFPGSTIHRHAEARDIPYVFVEFRQDLIDTKEKAVRWAEIFLEAIQPVLDDPQTHAGRKIKPAKVMP
jgi:predicted N-formylglutamate amidohydrolase